MTLFVWPPQNINTTGLATEATLLTIDGHVDGLETLVTATNTKLQDIITINGVIDGHVDGLETLVTATNAKLDTLNAKDFATETTLAKTRKWPYTNFDAQVLTQGALTDTWQYKTGGSSGTVVGTILITYTDTTKGTIASIGYTPVKTV